VRFRTHNQEGNSLLSVPFIHSYILFTHVQLHLVNSFPHYHRLDPNLSARVQLWESRLALVYTKKTHTKIFWILLTLFLDQQTFTSFLDILVYTFDRLGDDELFCTLTSFTRL
jgi:hypothetical protein